MELLKVKAVNKLSKAKVYDLTVQQNHNFYIGKSSILTHNCDYFSAPAQAIFRSMMEEFSDHTRYIGTCNYKDRIIEPLQSRFQSFEIKQLDVKQITLRIKHIIECEKITVSNNQDIVDLIKNCYPDVRKTINTLQKFTIDNVFKLDEKEILSDSYKSKLISSLKNKDSFESIRTMIVNSTINDYTILYKLLFDSVDEYCLDKTKKANILLNISEYMYRNSFVTDKEINFSACVIKIQELCK